MNYSNRTSTSCAQQAIAASVCKLLVLITLACFVLAPAAYANSDPDNGDWDAEFITLRDTSEAELMVRVGSINNVGFGFEDGMNPFTAKEQWSHTYPFKPGAGTADGTDRIMLGRSFTGENADGYSGFWAQNPEAATTRPITLEYDASGLTVRNALLQIVVDDFQAIRFGSHFVVTINGQDAPYIAEVLNHIDQSGPVVQLISVEIPDRVLPEVASGTLSLFIDESTGVGDGFAIDFVKLLVNYGRSKYVSRVEGKVVHDGGKPLANATVRVLGTRNVISTDEDGWFGAEVVSGLSAFRISKDGYAEQYAYVVAPAGDTVELPWLVWMEEGESSPDQNYAYFAAGDAWAYASEWASPELERAHEFKLIPARLVGQDLTLPINRAEFAAVVVTLYEALAGEAVLPGLHNPFTDSSDVDVLRAFSADLAVGISATEFAPGEYLNREQAATMLTRVVKKLSFPAWTYATDEQFSLEYPDILPFADDASISPWAKDSVYFMVANGIIEGEDDNAFSPRGVTTSSEARDLASTTREQALVLSLRMLERLGF